MFFPQPHPHFLLIGSVFTFPLHKSIHYTYAWKYETEPADEAGEKTRSDNFMRALLTQVVVADNELEDYTPKYGNPAINFATDDMGSDKAMGGVLLDILVVLSHWRPTLQIWNLHFI